MKAIKIAGGMLAVILVFVVGTFAETYIRSLARTPIPVVLEDDGRVKVTAHVQPDFLWLGQAWCIEVNSDAPVLIDLDGKWNAVIPSGINKVYSNHDVNNTTRFSSNSWWRTPSQITVKKLQPQPAAGGNAG